MSAAWPSLSPIDLVLIPGLWLDGSSWDAVVPVLEHAGHRTHPLTLPGIGSSDADRSMITLRDHVHAVVAMIDSLDPTNRHVVLVGRSGGGAIARAAGGCTAKPRRACGVRRQHPGPARSTSHRFWVASLGKARKSLLRTYHAPAKATLTSETTGEGNLMNASTAVTINRPENEIISRLPEAESPLADDSAHVSYAAAPGDRGTEMRVVLDESASGGGLGNKVAAVLGKDPQRQLDDAVRRFKQLLETGEVIRSDGSPEGTDATRQRRRRPAEPVTPTTQG